MNDKLQALKTYAQAILDAETLQDATDYVEWASETVSSGVEMGRNIEQSNEQFAVVFRFAGEKTIRRWNFDTHRKAVRKFNELKKQADWLPIREDITI